MQHALLALLSLTFATAALSQEPVIKPVHRPEPAFPAEANDPIYGENIKVAITVNKKGEVTAAKAWGPLRPCANLKDPVPQAIAKAAQKAAKETKFEPVLKDGKPIEMDMIITYGLRSKPVQTAEAPTIVESGVLKGRVLSFPRPAYPEAAKLGSITGSVGVHVLIGEDGRVISAAPVSGHPVLLDPATTAACKAVFAPTQLHGKTVKVNGIVTYNFFR